MNISNLEKHACLKNGGKGWGGVGGSFTRFTSIKDDQKGFTVNNISYSTAYRI